MSQIIKPSSGAGPVPPAVATSYVTDVNSPAIPAANVLIEIGGFVSTDTASGIQTDGSSGSNTLTVQLTNRLRGTATTIGAVTADLVTFALGATPATYVLDCNFVGFNAGTPAGVGYSIFGSVRTTGAASSLVGTPDKINNEDPALVACNADLVVSANNVILRVTGTAGLTINWVVVATYVKAV